jgi:hypothetical protein
MLKSLSQVERLWGKGHFNPIFRFRVNVVFHLAPPIIAAAIIEQSSCTNRRYPRGNCSITSSNIRSYAHRAFVPIGPRATLGLGVTFNRLLRLIARIPSSRKSQMVFRTFEANSSRNSSNLSLCIFILGEQPLLTPFGLGGGHCLFCVVFRLYRVSDTEEHLPTLDVLFRS